MSQSCPIIVELEQGFKKAFKTFRKRLKKAVRLGKKDHRSNLCILDSLFVRGRLIYCASQVAQQGGLGDISDLLIDLLANQLIYYCPGGSSTLLPSSLHSFVKMGTTLLGGSVWLSRSLVAAWWILKDSCQLTPESQSTLANVAMYCCRMCNKLIEKSSENSQTSLSWTVLTLAGIVMHLSSNDQSDQLKTQIKRTLKDINTQVFVDFPNIVLCKENRKIQKKIKSIVKVKKTIPLKIILMNVSVDQLIKVCLELEALESADIESKEPEISQGYQNCLQDSLKILLETTIFSTLSRKDAESRKDFDKQLKRKEKRNNKHASKAKNKSKKQTFNSQNYSESNNDDLSSSNLGSSISQYNKHLNYIGGSLSESELEIVGVVAHCLKHYDINKKNKILSSVPLPPTPPTSPGVDQIISNTVKTNKTKVVGEPNSKARDDVDEMNQFEFDPVTRSRYDGSLSFCGNSFTTITSAKKKKTYSLKGIKTHVDKSENNGQYFATNEKKEQIENKINDSELEVVNVSNTSSDSVDPDIKGVTIKNNNEDLRFDSFNKILERSDHSKSFDGEKSCDELETSDMEYQSSYYSEVNLSPFEKSNDSKNILQNERDQFDESSDEELREMNWNVSNESNLMDSQSKNKDKRILLHNIKHDAKLIHENENPKKQYLNRNNKELPSNSENTKSKRVEMEILTQDLNLCKIKNKDSKSVCDNSDKDFLNEDDLQNAQNLSDESCISNFILRNEVESSISQWNMSLAKFDSSTLINSDEARKVLVIEQQNENISQEGQSKNSFQDGVLPLNNQACAKGVNDANKVQHTNSNFLSPICSTSSFFLNQECSSVNTNSPKAIRSNIHIHSSGEWICDRMLISGRRVCMILDFDNTSNENIFEVRLLVEMEYGVDEVTFPISLINYEKISTSFENRTIEKRDLSTHNMSLEDNLVPSTPSIIPPTPKTPKSSYSFNFDSKQCAFRSKELCANNNTSFPINHHSNLNEFNDNYLEKRNENLNNSLPVEDIPLSSGMGPDTQSIFFKKNVCSTIELDNTTNENDTSNLLQKQDFFIPPSNSDVIGPLTREIFNQQNNNYNSDKESIDVEDHNKMAYSFIDVPNQKFIESSCIEELENIIPIPISRPTKRKLNFNKFMVKNKISSLINSSNSELSQYSLSSLSSHFSSSNGNLSNTSGFKVEELGDNTSKHPLMLSYIKRTPSWISDSLESLGSSGRSGKPTVSTYFERKNSSMPRVPRLQRSVTRKGLIRHYNKMRFRTKKNSLYNRIKKK